ncbi:MAG: phytoene/squalene synthase family protein [Aquabacterium sp.]
MSRYENTPPGPEGHFQPRAGSSLHYALQLTPVLHRPLVSTMLAIWHAMARIPLELSDPGVAEAKLRWWQQEWVRFSQGQAQHPLMTRLDSERKMLGAAPLDPAGWHLQAEGWIQLAHQNRWIDQASLDQHIDITTGQAAAQWAQLLGATSEPAQHAARTLGRGLRRAHLLSRLGQDARAGWVMVGIDLLQQHDVKAHQLTRPTSPPPDGWAALRDELVQRARGELRAGWQQATAVTSAERRALLPLLALARCADALCQELARSGDAVLHQRVVLTPLRKAWISGQTRWGVGSL